MDGDVVPEPPVVAAEEDHLGLIAVPEIEDQIFGVFYPEAPTADIIL